MPLHLAIHKVRWPVGPPPVALPSHFLTAMSSPPEACFCGRPRSGDSAWFCSDECARRDSLNTLLGLPSLPRTDSAGHTTVTEPPALPTSTVADRSSTSSGRKGHYRVVEAQRAAQRRSDIIERVSAAALSNQLALPFRGRP